MVGHGEAVGGAAGASFPPLALAFSSFAAAKLARLTFAGQARCPVRRSKLTPKARCKCCEVRRGDALGVSWCTWESCHGWALADWQVIFHSCSALGCWVVQTGLNVLMLPELAARWLTWLVMRCHADWLHRMHLAIFVWHNLTQVLTQVPRYLGMSKPYSLGQGGAV